MLLILFAIYIYYDYDNYFVKSVAFGYFYVYSMLIVPVNLIRPSSFVITLAGTS